MADWVKCTSMTESAKVIYVNLDRVTTIAPTARGCVLVGDGGSEFVVAEMVEEILTGARNA